MRRGFSAPFSAYSSLCRRSLYRCSLCRSSLCRTCLQHNSPHHNRSSASRLPAQSRIVANVHGVMPRPGARPFTEPFIDILLSMTVILTYHYVSSFKTADCLSPWTLTLYRTNTPRYLQLHTVLLRHPLPVKLFQDVITLRHSHGYPF